MNDSPEQDFTYRTLPRIGKRACRLGLSATYRPGRDSVREAIDAGVNLFFAYGFDSQVLGTFREMSPDERDQCIIITGGYNLTINRKPNLRKVVEKRLRQLGTDYLDALMWLGVLKPAHLSPYIIDEMRKLRDEGKARAIGISCHDRSFIAGLAAEDALDLYMLRYNAAHRGAETEIFPYLPAHRPDVVGYTATRWRYLLRRPRNWPEDGRVPTAAECYRFVLSDPHMDVVLTAPSNARQLRQNLAALEAGPLDEDDQTFMREFGDAVHARKNWFM